METVISRCAGLDVRKDSVTACVRVIDENGKLRSFTQSFGTTCSDLLGLNDWLGSYAVTIVGMESIGVYWKSTPRDRTATRIAAVASERVITVADPWPEVASDPSRFGYLAGT